MFWPSRRAAPSAQRLVSYRRVNSFKLHFLGSAASMHATDRMPARPFCFGGVLWNNAVIGYSCRPLTDSAEGPAVKSFPTQQLMNRLGTFADEPKQYVIITIHERRDSSSRHNHLRTMCPDPRKSGFEVRYSYQLSSTINDCRFNACNPNDQILIVLSLPGDVPVCNFDKFQGACVSSTFQGLHAWGTKPGCPNSHNCISGHQIRIFSNRFCRDRTLLHAPSSTHPGNI
jgi:hypothetical protein